MKKTIIALMALAGVACALDKAEINSSITEQLTAKGYVTGGSFSITLGGITQLGGHNNFAELVTLTDSVSIYAQEDVFVSINEGGTTSNAWLSSDSYTVDTSAKTASITLSSDALTGKGYWVVGRFATEQGVTSFYANGAARPNGVTDFTIAYDADTTTTSLIATRSDDSVHTIRITDLALDATDLVFKSTAVSASSVTVSVPEPTTATLSLLALAGLAARRRRK